MSFQDPITCPQQTSLINHSPLFGETRLGLRILLNGTLQADTDNRPEAGSTQDETYAILSLHLILLIQRVDVTTQ